MFKLIFIFILYKNSFRTQLIMANNTPTSDDDIIETETQRLINIIDNEGSGTTCYLITHAMMEYSQDEELKNYAHEVNDRMMHYACGLAEGSLDVAYDFVFSDVGKIKMRQNWNDPKVLMRCDASMNGCFLKFKNLFKNMFNILK